MVPGSRFFPCCRCPGNKEPAETKWGIIFSKAPVLKLFLTQVGVPTFLIFPKAGIIPKAPKGGIKFVLGKAFLGDFGGDLTNLKKPLGAFLSGVEKIVQRARDIFGRSRFGPQVSPGKENIGAF